MKISDTRILHSGVYRCCLTSVTKGLKTAELGDEAECAHCHELFILVKKNGRFLWIPRWQLDGEDD